MTDKNTIIAIENGVIRIVSMAPGTTLEVYDYDVEGDDVSELTQGPDGGECYKAIYHGPPVEDKITNYEIGNYDIDEEK